jgi:hypothetical protein
MQRQLLMRDSIKYLNALLLADTVTGTLDLLKEVMIIIIIIISGSTVLVRACPPHTGGYVILLPAEFTFS